MRWVIKDSKKPIWNYFRIGSFLFGHHFGAVGKGALAGILYKPSSGRKVAREA